MLSICIAFVLNKKNCYWLLYCCYNVNVNVIFYFALSSVGHRICLCALFWDVLVTIYDQISHGSSPPSNCKLIYSIISLLCKFVLKTVLSTFLTLNIVNIFLITAHMHIHMHDCYCPFFRWTRVNGSGFTLDFFYICFGCESVGDKW